MRLYSPETAKSRYPVSVGIQGGQLFDPLIIAVYLFLLVVYFLQIFSKRFLVDLIMKQLPLQPCIVGNCPRIFSLGETSSMTQ